MELILNRSSHNKFGTFGELIVGDSKFYTVEQDWENNRSNVSCIPNGVYIAEFYNSQRHGRSYIIHNQDLGIGKFKGDARRFGCLIHKANLASELEGCIAIGKGLGFYKGQWCVVQSKKALQEIYDLLGHQDEHKLIIKSAFPSFVETS